ncbi:hypothetical protein [Parvibaculum sp.]|uniref:hypothetical protein n=1 Tax=Parvibaculum sp. TaxID=2024848 RepID=UPI0027318665|nr:hypothetical protein [Parvibaculum sp.]MDP2151723.1 hypothetical protein [Parvibaculum sp.]MDP3328306.1 hypothetical protein [Parvibaculum sp.]
MAKPLNLIEARDKALLSEIVYSNGLAKGDFGDGSGAAGWVMDELVRRVPKDLKRNALWGNRAAGILQQRYGPILATRRSGTQGNPTGADMCIVRDRLTGRYVLCVDGTAMSGGSKGESWHDILANFDNFFDPSANPRGALLRQIDAVEGFLADFTLEEAPKRGVKPDDIAAITDLTGHSLGALVCIALKRRRDRMGAPLGCVVGWSPPAEGGGVTLIPLVGAVYSHLLLDAHDISILTTFGDVAKLAGARPAASVFELGKVHGDAIESHMIYRHTPLLEAALDDYVKAIPHLGLSSAEQKGALASPFLMPSSRVPEGIALLPAGKNKQGMPRSVYVSTDGGSLRRGGYVTISRDQYAKFRSSGSFGHIHEVLRELAFRSGEHAPDKEIPDIPHNVVKTKTGHALAYTNDSDFRVAYMRALGSWPSRTAMRMRLIELDGKIDLKVLAE